MFSHRPARSAARPGSAGSPAGWARTIRSARGEFAILPHASAAAILDTLQHGKPALKLVTIPEGTPSVIVHDKLIATIALTGAVPVPPEGSVLPDSYAYLPGQSRLALVQRMQKAMDKALAAEWAGRGTGLAVSTPKQALILASIVEKETGLAAERATVAGVYGNRLKLNMLLQADPTVIYPVTKGRPARPAHPRVRAAREERLQHLCRDRAAGRADLQPRSRLDPCGAASGGDQGRSISSPTARAATSSPTRSPSRMQT